MRFWSQISYTFVNFCHDGSLMKERLRPEDLGGKLIYSVSGTDCIPSAYGDVT